MPKKNEFCTYPSCNRGLATRSIAYCEFHLKTNLIGSKRYQKKHLSEGKCANCPRKRSSHSIRYCDYHLMAQRNYYHRIGK
jgi:hypothetical protein